MKEITIQENEAGQRFDKFLKKYLDRAGAGFIYKMLRKKNITLNGKKADGREMLKKGDAVRIFFADETLERFHSRADQKFIVKKKRPVKLDIVYEDLDVLAVDKPAGMLTQRGNGPERSLSEYLPEYLLERGDMTEEEMRAFHPAPVNRLDRNTSGLVLCGRTLKGQQFLSEMIRRRDVRKEYLCLVSGRMEKKQTARYFYRKKENENRVVLSETYEEGMGTMETELVPVVAGDEATLVRATLITGKSHQIRATLAFLGHPILGDPKYGDRTQNRIFFQKTGIRRQMLHAFRVIFPDIGGPFSRLSAKMLEAAVPRDFRKALERFHLKL